MDIRQALLVAAAPLAACAGLTVRLPPNALVRDEAAAVEIGRAGCLKQGFPSAKGHWWATYDDGVWDVLFQRPESRGLGPDYEVKVAVSDGKAGSCSIIIPGD
jgi:hypothetical protein